METNAGPCPISSEDTREHPVVRQALRFVLGMLIIVVSYMLLMSLLKCVFLIANWSNLKGFGFSQIAGALWMGVRFDAAVLSAVLVPAGVLYHIAAVSKGRVVRWALQALLALFVLVLPGLAVADIQYFEEAGKHFTYEVFTHLSPTDAPVFMGAFQLHPVVNSVALLASIGLAVAAWVGFGRLLKFSLPRDGRRHLFYLFAGPAWFAVGFGAFCGFSGYSYHAILKPSAALISPNPYINALCTNPPYSIFWTTVRGPGRYLEFFDEAHNVRVVRELLGCGDTPPISSRYPLLRYSPGTKAGNRKNVVIFLLESWTGKDIGCLGGDRKATPVFDKLASEGLLFTHFYANGIRTPEGVVSMLCSFPNQLHRPIMNQPAMFQDRWRSLSQILEETGYATLFIHGRDLDFDNMSNVLRFIRFHKLIDKNSFSRNVRRAKGSWAGYGDKEVMIRADAEFTALNDRPFLGVIYTLNTHPPFTIPAEFPKLYSDDTAASRFFNALRYSDDSLDVFFQLARTRRYFKDTIFVFVADHARTRDTFNYENQHHIPFLIYAPGYVASGVRTDAAGQGDILPTLLDLLNLKTLHASWGRDLMKAPPDNAFAVSVAGDEARWHDDQYLLVDTLSDQPALMFDLRDDPDCTRNCLAQHPSEVKVRQDKLKAYMTLSQDLLFGNRIYPGAKDPLLREQRSQ